LLFEHFIVKQVGVEYRGNGWIGNVGSGGMGRGRGRDRGRGKSRIGDGITNPL
jgi:hypothetical protein